MSVAALSCTDLGRLSVLRDYSILDTPPEAPFDDISRLAALICKTPAAAVSFVDARRQWYKSYIGFPFREVPVEASFCAHALDEKQLFIVSDALADDRFAGNPLVVGEPRLRSYAGALLRSPNGYALGTVCVTDHKPRKYSSSQTAALLALGQLTMAHLELRRSLAHERRLAQDRGRVMAIAGHDLMQPLQVIAALVERLGPSGTHSAAAASPPDAPQIESARAAIETLASELDALARASQDGRESAVTIVDIPLGDFVARVVQSWRHHASKKKLTLRAFPSSAVARSDERLLTAIVGNLVGNAIKYTLPGGTVLVDCRRRGAQVIIEVRDNGIGIPEGERENIFKAFKRLSPDEADGLGLGLTLVKQAADQLGCTIDVRSRPGVGSVFSIALPAAGARRSAP